MTNRRVHVEDGSVGQLLHHRRAAHPDLLGPADLGFTDLLLVEGDVPTLLATRGSTNSGDVGEQLLFLELGAERLQGLDHLHANGLVLAGERSVEGELELVQVDLVALGLQLGGAVVLIFLKKSQHQVGYDVNKNEHSCTRSKGDVFTGGFDVQALTHRTLDLVDLRLGLDVVGEEAGESFLELIIFQGQAHRVIIITFQSFSQVLGRLLVGRVSYQAQDVLVDLFAHAEGFCVVAADALLLVLELASVGGQPGVGVASAFY
eukprot:CAMPEP_0170481718 /NCGR_PEP_ID=MMETSP0208-20121228/2050_1 /TAXON_ID=197538 /ORGANISM="Strombidium inclinatum, Strain S3" /LENGTH=261 /DNA_ID=CAMNT_0010754469 /DNA_START=56 /DNA_END=841 /DNA_ORIENTATION=-